MTLTYSHFTKKVPCFCEGYLYGKEYINTITSFFISYMGFYGLNNNNDIDINILYSLLTANGIFSALNHYYNIEGFSYLDQLTMMLSVNLGNLYIYEFYLSQLSSWNNIYKLFYFLFPSTIYLTFALNKFTAHFDYIFLFSCLLLLGFVPLINYYGNDKCVTKIRDNFVKGSLLVMIGAGLWWYSEPKCRDPKISKKFKKKIAKLHLHGIWHILSGYGFYLMIHSINMIKLYDKDPSDDTIKKILNSFNHIIPVI